MHGEGGGRSSNAHGTSLLHGILVMHGCGGLVE